MKRKKDTRFFDEKDIPQDVWSVLKVASVLSIGEFRVFEIAYEQWFGGKGDEKTIETYFIPYMFKDVVPVWVRHFCQQVLFLEDEGRLDPQAYGIVEPSVTREQQYRGVEYIVWIFAFLVLLIIGAQMAARFISKACMFPPCY